MGSINFDGCGQGTQQSECGSYLAVAASWFGGKIERKMDFSGMVKRNKR